MLPSLEIRYAEPSDEALIRAMLESYLQELGMPQDYPYLPLYWQDEERLPYLLLRDGTAIGFALTRFKRDTRAAEIAEFYIAPSHRKNGIGRLAALAVIKNAPGNWEISVLGHSAPSLEFWRAVLSACESAKMIGETIDEKHDGDRTIFHFKVA